MGSGEIFGDDEFSVTNSKLSVITLNPCQTKFMYGWSILSLVSSPGVDIVWTVQTRKCKLAGRGAGSGPDI